MANKPEIYKGMDVTAMKRFLVKTTGKVVSVKDLKNYVDHLAIPANRKKAKGGSVKKNLKPVPKGNKGLSKLPTQVRNKMGFMKKGGLVKGGTSSQMTGKEYKGIF